jgi:cytoskeletal protein RodZ
MKLFNTLASALLTIALMGCQIEVAPIEAAMITIENTDTSEAESTDTETSVSEGTTTESEDTDTDETVATDETEEETASEEDTATDETAAGEETEENTTTDETTATEEDTSADEETIVTGSLTLEWMAPVERENGELLTEAEIGGFKILYRASDSDHYETLVIDTTAALITAYTFDLALGDYEFKVAAFDTEGLYSAYSDTAIISVDQI